MKWADCLENSSTVAQIMKEAPTVTHSPPMYWPKEIKACDHTKTCTQMFMAAFFMPAKTWKQCNCASTGEWTHHGTGIQWITAQQWKQMFYWYNNLDDSQNNYAQWNRGETELDKVLYDSNYVKFLKTCKLIYSGRKQIRAVWENKAGREEGLQKGTKLLWDDGYVYDFHCDDGFLDAYVCQNSLCALNM